MATVFSRKRAGGKLAWYTKLKDHTGEWKQVLLKAVRTEPQAQKLADELEKEQERLNKGLQPGKRFRGTFSELCDWAYEVHFKRLRGKQGERSRFDCHAGPKTPLGQLPAARVTSEEIEKYLNAYAETKTVRGKPPSGDTINRLRSTLSSVFSVATKHGIWPDQNPASKTQRREVMRQTHSILALEEIAPVLTEVPEYWRGCVAVGLLAGLRKGEILALHKSDVDIQRRMFTVQRSNEFAGTKGSTRPDPVPIHEALVPYLDPWLETPGPLLFPDRHGQQRPRTVHMERLVRVAMVRAGFCDWYDHKCRRCKHVERHRDAEPRRCPDCQVKLWPVGHARHVRFHDTRHTFASHALMSGASLQSVQKILRHKDPRLTVNTYGHLSAGHLGEEVNRIRLPGSPSPAQPESPPSTIAHDGEHPHLDRIVPSDEPSLLGAPVVRVAQPLPISKSHARPASIETALNRAAEAHSRTPRLFTRSDTPSASSFEQASQAVVSADGGSPPSSAGSALVTPSRAGLGAPVVRIEDGPHQVIGDATPGGTPHGAARVPSHRQPLALFTVREVAQRLRVSLNWVYREIAAQQLGHLRVGAHIRVPVEALDLYLRRFTGLRVEQPIVAPAAPSAQRRRRAR